jgi:cell division septal protein FtsQ
MSETRTHKGRRQRKAKGATRFMFGLTLCVIALEIVLLLLAVLVIAPTMSERMVLKQLVITGNRFADSTEIKKTLALNPGAPLMDIDPKKLEKRLEETRFIKSAEVTRCVKPYGDIFDGTLKVQVLDERVPVAKAYLFDRKYWLLSDGTLASIFAGDSSELYNSARRSPEIRMNSVRQKDSPEIMNGILKVLSVLTSRAPGQIREIRFDDSSNAILYANSGFPLKLNSLDKPEVSLANIPDLLRMVDSEKGKYAEAILDPYGENTLKIKEKVITVGGDAGVISQ